MKIEQEETECPKDERNKQIAKLYFKTGWKLVKLYMPSILVGAAGIGCNFKSHKMMVDRNAAAAAAYSILSEAVSAYRDRVKESLGEDEERNLWAKKFELPKAEDAPKVEDKDIYIKDRKGKYGIYAKCFDASMYGWDDNPQLTLYFLKCVETQANNLLQSRGHLFLNEVYDLLGYERSRIGQYVGWIYDPSDSKRSCYVDFGLYDLHDPTKRLFINGYEQNVWLDFNVDGVIVNDIPDGENKFLK